MGTIEQIAGASRQELWEHEWPESSRTEDFVWPAGIPPRGSVRLFAGRVIDRVEVAKKWKTVRTKLLKLL